MDDRPLLLRRRVRDVGTRDENLSGCVQSGECRAWPGPARFTVDVGRNLEPGRAVECGVWRSTRDAPWRLGRAVLPRVEGVDGDRRRPLVGRHAMALPL